MSNHLVVACVKPIAIGEPSIARGQLVVEGLAWGLPASERRTLACAHAAAQALGAELHALALGPKAAQAGLREALALGAKRATLVESDSPRLDAILTARVLAAAIRRLGEPQVVVAGGESADAQQGLLGPMLAEMLSLDLLTGAEKVQAHGKALRVHRRSGGEEEHFTAQPPLVITASPRFNPSPHPTSWGIGEAYALPLQTWRLGDLGLSPGDLQPGSDLASLTRAEQAKGEAERFEGDADEATGQLVRRLRAGGWTR